MKSHLMCLSRRKAPIGALFVGFEGLQVVTSYSGSLITSIVLPVTLAPYECKRGKITWSAVEHKLRRLA